MRLPFVLQWAFVFGGSEPPPYGFVRHFFANLTSVSGQGLGGA